MRRIVTAVFLAGLAATLPLGLRAAHAASQPPPATSVSPAGRWEGKLNTPNQELDVIVDIVAKGSGWDGVISIPAQNLKGFPLRNLTVKGDTVSFGMAAPGDPLFTGKIDATGKTLAGDFTQGGGTLTFSLTRTGDAKIEPPAPSTAIDKTLEGTWEGALEAGGRTLRLVLKLSTGADGLGKGVLTSVDQGNVEIAVQTVSQTGPKLTLLIPVIAGSFEGELKGEQLEGTWKQGPGALPLSFKRAAK